MAGPLLGYYKQYQNRAILVQKLGEEKILSKANSGYLKTLKARPLTK